MEGQNPLKRKMLSNPSTGSYKGHPQPHPSQLNEYTDSAISSNTNTNASLMQNQLDQAVGQLVSDPPHAKSTPAHAAPKTKGPSITDQAPDKPKKPIILPPKIEKPQTQDQLTPNVAQDLAEQLAEAPVSHIASHEELERIKQLNSFKPVVIGTTLFILGLIISAILAIVFNLI